MRISASKSRAFGVAVILLGTITFAGTQALPAQIWNGFPWISNPKPKPKPVSPPAPSRYDCGEGELWIVPATASNGVVWNGSAGTYDFTVVSPEGGGDKLYQQYVWGNNRNYPVSRVHGTNVLLGLGVLPQFSPDKRVVQEQPDHYMSTQLFDPPTQNKSKRAADGARGKSLRLTLREDGFVSAIVDGIMGNFGKYWGAVQFCIYKVHE